MDFNFVSDHGVFAKLNDGTMLYAKDTSELEATYDAIITSLCRKIVRKWQEEGAIILTDRLYQVNDTTIHLAKYFKFKSVPDKDDLELVLREIGFHRIHSNIKVEPNVWLRLDGTESYYYANFTNYDEYVSNIQDNYMKLLQVEAAMLALLTEE